MAFFPILSRREKLLSSFYFLYKLDFIMLNRLKGAIVKEGNFSYTANL